MFVIGITGGIASGKSTVVNVLASLNVMTVKADTIGHKAYQQGTDCYNTLVEKFGNAIIGDNGDINRRRLGEIVFSDSLKMVELTDIVWPEIRKLLVKELEDIRNNETSTGVPTFVALEAAVMIEAGWNNLVSTLWVLHVDPNVARSQLMARNNLSFDEASKRISSQISNDDRCKHATEIIYNDGSIEQLEVKTRQLFRETAQAKSA